MKQSSKKFQKPKTKDATSVENAMSGSNTRIHVSKIVAGVAYVMVVFACLGIVIYQAERNGRGTFRSTYRIEAT